LYIVTVQAKLRVYVCVWKKNNVVSQPGSPNEIRRRPSNELDEVWKANWSRTEIGIRRGQREYLLRENKWLSRGGLWICFDTPHCFSAIC